MKKYLLLIIASVVIISTGVAQNTPSDSQTETLKAKKTTSKQERFIFNFMLDSWLKQPSNIKTNWLKSRGFEFYLMKDKAFANGHIGFGYGLGFSFTDVNSNTRFDIINGNTIMNPIADGIVYSQNKLSTNFIEVPLELRFRTSKNNNGKRLKMAVGVKASYLLQDHLKYEDPALKVKTFDMQNLSPFRFVYEGRIGFGSFSLCGYYGINNLFKKDKGTAAIPFGLGITFAPEHINIGR